MTALDHRLQKIEEALPPVEAVVRWLDDAKQRHPTFAGYCNWLHENPQQLPFLILPRRVAAWAGHVPGRRQDTATETRIDRAVRSALVRAFLVERCNWMLSWS